MGYYYVQKISGARKTENFSSENAKLKRHLKVTRQNNAILRKKMSHLTLTNADLKTRLQEIKADFTTGNAELIVIKEEFDKLKKNNTETYSDLQSIKQEKKELMTSLQDVNKKLDAEIKVRLQYQSEKLELAAKELTNRELIFELKTNVSKLTSEALNNQTSSERKILVLKTNLNETQEEILNCEKSLQVYQDPNWTFSSFQKICSEAPIWSEWSACSKSCFGMTTRKDKCNAAKEQIDLCNDHSVCHQSGNSKIKTN